FRYSTLFGGEQAAAGIMDASAFLPDGVPAHWAVYFNVRNADAALSRVVELGGAVVLPAEDTPFGRLAAVTDSTGAMFKLCQPGPGGARPPRPARAPAAPPAAGARSAGSGPLDHLHIDAQAREAGALDAPGAVDLAVGLVVVAVPVQGRDRVARRPSEL